MTGLLTITFTFTHLADAFIQSDLQCIQVIHFFLSVRVFPGNRTHNLCAANTMLYHWATGILCRRSLVMLCTSSFCLDFKSMLIWCLWSQFFLYTVLDVLQWSWNFTNTWIQCNLVKKNYPFLVMENVSGYVCNHGSPSGERDTASPRGRYGERHQRDSCLKIHM